MGQALYPSATRLLITADAGGSNGYRLRLWKLELQKLADETGLEIDVCHLPPGTSKWNKIEHRLFPRVRTGAESRSPRGGVNLIAHAPDGLRVQSPTNRYPAGRTVSDDELEAIYLRRDSFHGEWNYSLLPRVALLN